MPSMAPPSYSSSLLPLKVLVIVGSSCCCTSAFTSSSSSAASSSRVNVDVVSFDASLERVLPSWSSWPLSSSSSSPPGARLSRTSRISLVQRGSSSQTQSIDDELFFARELGAQQQQQQQYNDNASASSKRQTREDYFSKEQGDAYLYSRQDREDSQQSDFQTQIIEHPSSSSSSSSSSSPLWQTNNYSASSTAEGETPSSSNNHQQPISSVDARVLESILQEGKLDLSAQAQVKRLLQEGPRRRPDEERSSREEKEKEKYNSKFFNAVLLLADDDDDTKTYWNSLKAKAAEIIESVGIYVENRIERDAQTLAAVGLFALDRIRRDVGRALPAAARKLLLAERSSSSTTTRGDERMSSSSGEEEDVYDELSTPADEIRQVSEAILDILSGKPYRSDSSSYSSNYSRRSVRSLAPAGTSKLAERQRRAYRARRQTALKREREGMDRKVGRALGSATDAAWEFRREMQTDAGREAGYRSRGVRNALAAGAARLLEASRENNSRRLWSAEETSNLSSGRSTAFGEEEMMGSNIVDVSPSEEEEGIIADVIEETNMEYAPDGLLSPRSFVEEKQRVVASLESCLSRPSETWLTKEIVAQATASGIMLDGAILRQAIADLVTLRDELQKELDCIVTGQVDLNMAFVQTDLRRMKQSIDSVASLAISAAGESAAYMLKKELEGFVLSDSLDDIIETELERMEQLLAEIVASREKKMQSQKQQYFMDSSVSDDNMNKSRGASARSGRRSYTRYTEVEVVSTPDRSTVSYEKNMMDQGQDDTDQASSRVEIVPESEYSEYERQFKYARNYAMGKEIDEVNEDNPVFDVVLRVVDVVFFIAEKVILVLPDVIMSSVKIFSRYGDAQNRGRGSVGWKPLKNAKQR